MQKDILALLGKRIKQIRAETGVSQEELAFRAELNTAYLSEVENGKRNISAKNLYKIAKSLNREVGELFPPI